MSVMTLQGQPGRPTPTSSQSNKLRLYLLFYRSPDHAKFHAALTIAPKNPDPAKVQTLRFRAGESKQVVNYDQRMVAAVLLCKLDPDVTGVGLSMLLSREVPVYDSGGGGGGGRQWVCDAINLLVDRKVIPALPLSVHSLWEKGYHFAESVEEDEDRQVPTCDVYGARIRSELSRIS